MKAHLNSGETIEVDILNCPFCGEMPKIENIGNEYTKSRKIRIKCPKCRICRTDAALKHSSKWLLENAVKQWNQRVI